MLRERGKGEAEVKPVELFFDLAYVLAVTQITHHLVDHLTWRSAGEALLLSAVWERWISTTWITNYLDMGTRPVRLILIGVMFASLMMSAALPEAFESRGLSFAIAPVAIQVGGPASVLADIDRGHHLSLVLAR